MKGIVRNYLRSALPKEHGLTAIWLSSTLAGLLSAKGYFDPARFASALGASVALLITSSLANRYFKVSVEARRSAATLLASLTALTLLTPISYILAAGTFDGRVAAVWLLLVFYTIFATLSARRRVRQILLSRRGRSLDLTIGGCVLLASISSLLVYTHQLPYTALLTPLILPAVSLVEAEASAPKAVAVRRVGIAHLFGMLAFSISISAT